MDRLLGCVHTVSQHWFVSKVEEQAFMLQVLQLDAPQSRYPRDHEKIPDAIL